MPFVFSDPTRESDPNALPNIEVFEIGFTTEGTLHTVEALGYAPRGWYWWPCFQGCLPDSEDAIGPFDTEAEAVADAQLE